MYPLNRYRTRDRSGFDTLFMTSKRVLSQYGTGAHLWMPGVGYVNGVTASNWIDSAGTVAGAVDQPVGLVVDSGGGVVNATQGTTAAKPILRQTSGRYSWQFDGTDDHLALSAAPFQIADAHTVICAARLNANNVFQTFFNVGGAGVQSFIEINVNGTGYPRVLFRDSSGATSSVIGGAALLAAKDYVASYTHASGAVALRINGAASGSGSLSTASAGAIASGAVGVRIADSSSRFAGHLYPVIAIKGTVTNADLLTLEKFVGACSGVTI